MREHGFVAYREPDGRVGFVDADVCADLVARGRAARRRVPVRTTLVSHTRSPAMTTDHSDRTPAGWFALDVMLAAPRVRVHWVALMIDVDPDDFWAGRTNASGRCVVRIPGKHRTREAAWEAIEDMMATRHRRRGQNPA